MANLQRPELSQVQAEFDRTTAAYDAAVRKATVLGEQLSLYSKGAQELAVLAGRMAKFSAAYQLAAALAETAKGNNASKDFPVGLRAANYFGRCAAGC